MARQKELEDMGMDDVTNIEKKPSASICMEKAIMHQMAHSKFFFRGVGNKLNNLAKWMK